MLGLAPRLPITITLLTSMTANLLVRLRPLPVHRAGRAALSFHSRANFFRAALVSGERLIVSIFPLGLSQNLEAEGKMRGVGGMGGLRFRDAKPRRSAEAGQDS